MTTTLAVRTVTVADRTSVVTALSGAFYDDPVFRWIYPDDARRVGVLPPFFEIFTDAIARHGVSVAAGAGVGAALWVPPGEEVVDAADEDAFVDALLGLSAEDADRAATCMALLGEAHPHEAHWYLNLLGVAPGSQGQGIGSAMLRAVLDRCDAEGTPAYLEATSPTNRRLYERHGFRVVGDLALPGGPSLWPMWREPAA